MLYQIVSLLLEVAAGLLTGIFLLRLYMQHQRIPMSARSGNPMGPFMFALTDWLVLPLRRVLPAVGRLDTASLVAAFLTQLALFGAQWLMLGGGAGWISVPVLALFGVVRMTISALTGDEATTIEDFYEPYLLQIGFIERTPRGRRVTPKAFKHVGKKHESNTAQQKLV